MWRISLPRRRVLWRPAPGGILPGGAGWCVYCLHCWFYLAQPCCGWPGAAAIPACMHLQLWRVRWPYCMGQRCFSGPWRALPVPGDALEAEQFQALVRHLRFHTPQVRWKHGQVPLRRRLPRPLRAVLLVLALAAALGAAAYGAGLRASLSPSLRLAVFYKNPVTGKALHLRGFRAQQFPYTVQGSLKLQWLTGDVCTATYEGEDGRTHQYIATFGDRGSGVSYYYVGSALVGVWEPIGQNTAGWRLEATDGPGGHITLENGSYRYEYEYSDCVQAGTLALALCRGGLPEWTVALGQDFEFQNADSGGVAGGGSIVVCRVSMEKTAPLTMNYLGYPG